VTTRPYFFDAYGTLFDVHAAIALHRDRVGPDADRISELWRSKQLEYTWTLTAMGVYENFERLTARALDFVLARFGKAGDPVRDDLLAAYRTLGAYPETREALSALKSSGHVTGILSNGSPGMLDAAVHSAGLDGVLDHVLSIDAIGIYKPRREAYERVTRRLGCAAGDVGFVSSNRWDIAGATQYGFRCIWVNRANLPDEYPGQAPDAMVRDLRSIAALDL
jgi:2-haloacid dehalogenase